MLQSIKQVIVNCLNQTPDPRTIDPMSMTLHDCIRLVHPSEPSAMLKANDVRAETPLNMKQNLDSLQPHFIKHV